MNWKHTNLCVKHITVRNESRVNVVECVFCLMMAKKGGANTLEK